MWKKLTGLIVFLILTGAIVYAQKKATTSVKVAPKRATTTTQAPKKTVQQKTTIVSTPPKTAGSTVATSKNYPIPKLKSVKAPPAESHAVISQRPGPVLRQGGPVLSQSTPQNQIEARFQNILRQRGINYIPTDHCEAARNFAALDQARLDVLGNKYNGPSPGERAVFMTHESSCRVQTLDTPPTTLPSDSRSKSANKKNR